MHRRGYLLRLMADDISDMMIGKNTLYAVAYSVFMLIEV